MRTLKHFATIILLLRDISATCRKDKVFAFPLLPQAAIGKAIQLRRTSMGFGDTTSLASPTAATLSLRHMPAEGDAKAIVLIQHGLAEHAARYAEFARLLASRGYHVYAHDHRGHGHTRAPDAEKGRFAWRNGTNLVVEDVMAIHRKATGAHPNLPVILFGHSMGGMIALATAIAHPDAFAGLAVWNTNLDHKLAVKAGILLLQAERALKGSDVPSRFGPKVSFEAWAKTIPNARTAFDWLNHDARSVAEYLADPLCGFPASVSLWLDIFTTIDRISRTDELARLPRNLPVNLVGGGQDPATDGGKAVRWLARRLKELGMTAVDTTIYDDMRHETLHELARQEAMKAFAAWTDGVVQNLVRMAQNV
jgi:alpha-beta hydrolase superfamily lysophospholipase